MDKKYKKIMKAWAVICPEAGEQIIVDSGAELFIYRTKSKALKRESKYTEDKIIQVEIHY